MATARYTLSNSSWTQVALSSENFIIDNQSTYNVDIAVTSTAPDSSSGYITLKPEAGIARLGTVGDVYARASNSGEEPVIAVIT